MEKNGAFKPENFQLNRKKPPGFSGSGF